MALQENVASRLAYKAYSSGLITSNAEAVSATDLGPSGAQVLRRVASTLQLRKDTYQSNEVREDRQIADFRHGIRRVSGDLEGELSPGTYWDLMEAVMRGTASASITKTQADFTSMAADNSLSTFTVGGSTWAAQGFRVGDIIRPTGLSATDNNNRNYTILSLANDVATVYPAPTTMTADTTFSITRPGQKLTIPTTLGDFVKRKFAFEHYHQDIGVAELFTECRMSRMACSLPATGLATVTFGVMGRNKENYEASQAPFFAAPASAGTAGVTAAVNGLIMVDGVRQGVITGIDFTLDLASDAPAVAGQNYVPEIFLGRANVSGTINALFENLVLDDYFLDETEIRLIVQLNTTSDADSPFLGFTFPRIKLGGADKALRGEAGLPISLPFQALIPPATTGVDQSTLVITDSLAA